MAARRISTQARHGYIPLRAYCNGGTQQQAERIYHRLSFLSRRQHAVLY